MWNVYYHTERAAARNLIAAARREERQRKRQVKAAERVRFRRRQTATSDTDTIGLKQPEGGMLAYVVSDETLDYPSRLSSFTRR
jgi:hypothetical protein